LHISPIFRNFVPPKNIYTFMQSNHELSIINYPLSISSVGRTELAIRYFPNIQPTSAWLKLRSLLADDPALAPLATLRRRTFLPAEVAKIYASLGHP